MTKIIFILLFILSSVIGLAQDTTTTKKKISYKNQLNILSKQQVNLLHDGVLLVRLKTKKNSIEALRKRGNNVLADKIEKQQADLNKEIINTFTENFDFCPTYFFLSDFTNDIKEKRLDNVEFLDKEMHHDPSIVLTNKNFLIAEFGNIAQDTAQYSDVESHLPEENNQGKHTRQYGGASMSFGALIIKSDQFVQLRKPFPYYSRTFESFPIKPKMKKVIQKLNTNLVDFYKSKNE